MTLIHSAWKASTYRVGDSVYWAAPGSRATTGPYFISKVSETEQYTLCDNNGNNVNNGDAVPEGQLMAA